MTMSSSAQYDPQSVEDKWYAHWMEKNYFRSVPDEREAYSIVIPPPNVTGVLHMGHMLNNTIQDILIRKARLEGKNACWVPGMDHASIATEAKVVRMLREKGIRKADISREQFLEYAFEWKDKYGGIILEQLKKLGASCDWERTRFTMEESLSRAVIKIFVDLYGKGKLYRGLRMTNWDPEAKTVLSNEEVLHEEEDSHLYHIRYRFEDDPSKFLIIATQRPETIMADVAVAVHPRDERFSHLIGKNVIIPLIDRAIPVIGDKYVDVEFGTGALKITPAHDPNDHEIGARHDLPVIDILNEDGTLNDAAQILVGEDRFDARISIKVLLKEGGHLEKLENYRTKIGRSERTSAVVEPRLSKQWFLSMKDFAKTALDAVDDGDVRFFPANMKNMYNSWLKEENVRDWCISRQLWWGQQIPAWYLRDGSGDTPFVAVNAEKALALAIEKTGNANLALTDLYQDEDVVDTWFSSWLWPISVFDGFERQDELAYYYPTNTLVTAWDIIFFWVARMIMAGYEYAGELLDDKKEIFPFKDVFFTGMVRDNKRRKMSKSLGNSPNALALIEKYGADGVRFGMLSSAVAGNDIVFDAPFDEATNKIQDESKLCEQGLRFCNKIWNALRLINRWTVDDSIQQSDANALVTQWFENRLNQVIEGLNADYKQYRLSDALKKLYALIWDDFCSFYLESIKPDDDKIDSRTVERSRYFYEKMMTLLHPFMPFVTEEIWHLLQKRNAGDDCMMSSYPSTDEYNAELIQRIEDLRTLITRIREIKNQKGISANDRLELKMLSSDTADKLLTTDGSISLLEKLAVVRDFSIENAAESSEWIEFISGREKFFIKAGEAFNVDEEISRIEEELSYHRGFLSSVEKKLKNERFIQNAPAAVVEMEKKKLADGQSRIKNLEESLARLKN